MTEQELLQSTIDYYSVDPKNRRCSDDTQRICNYYPGNTGKIKLSEGCAIGRHLSEKIQRELDSLKYPGISVILTTDKKLLLPEWMQNMDSWFLTDIQNLHDDKYNWEDIGLSEKGRQMVEGIIKKYNLQLVTYIN